MSPNVAASVRARLLNKGQASERFLYRLGASGLRKRFVLKGAGLLATWMDDPYRATRDLDLLAFGPSDEASIRAVVETICAVPCPEDGLRFDLASLDISPIRAAEEDPGQRAVFRAYLGTAKIRLQVDFGFGDAVASGPVDAEYPVLLAGLPHPRLLTYPRVASIAEKFEAMVQLGRRNGRMKDFHDVWGLSSQFSFDGPGLREAVFTCFERRGTAWTPEVPDILTPAFYRDAEIQPRWSAYVRGGTFRADPPAAFAIIGERIVQFLGPVRSSVVAERPFDTVWPAGGPWTSETKESAE